jgi:hypothetical protein
MGVRPGESRADLCFHRRQVRGLTGEHHLSCHFATVSVTIPAMSQVQSRLDALSDGSTKPSIPLGLCYRSSGVFSPMWRSLDAAQMQIAPVLWQFSEEPSELPRL